MPEVRPHDIALRLLGRDDMDLVEACFAADTSLPRAFQETLSGEQIAAIRVWEDHAVRVRGLRGERTHLVDPDLPRPPD